MKRRMRDAISFSAARKLVREIAPLVLPDRLTLAEAAGWPCAADLYAKCGYPLQTVSAMDGYAIRSAATTSASPQQPICLPLDGLAAMTVATGSHVPPPFDAVVMRERVRIGSRGLELEEPVPLGRNVRPRAEDGAEGDLLVRAGTILNPAKVAALANFGIIGCTARRPPRIGLVVTGDEVATGEDGIHDANGPMVEAFSRSLRVPLSAVAHARDDAAAIAAAVAKALDAGAGLIVTTGGTSVGTRDRLRAAVRLLGGELLFHGVKMRPGKPLLCASLPGGAPLLGLPGPPTAALIAYRFFVFEALRAAIGLEEEIGLEIAGARSTPAGTTAVIWPGNASLRQGAPCFDADPDHRPQRVAALLRCDAWLVEDEDERGASRRRAFAAMPAVAGTPFVSPAFATTAQGPDITGAFY